MALDRASFYDAELRRHQQHLRDALKIGRADCVLDIGCGAGQTTLDAAATAKQGSVVGVDVSEEMLEIARQRSVKAGLRNVSFERADAQVHAFPPDYFDLCFSRFGTMFFADPVAAFTNIGRAMRPGARLVQMVWQGRECNEWAVAIQQALAPADGTPSSVSPAFSLGDREITTQILTASGFVSIEFAAVHEPVFYGPDVDVAYEAVVGLFVPEQGHVDKSSTRVEVLERLRALVNSHATADGVLFDSRAWIVTARRVS